MLKKFTFLLFSAFAFFVTSAQTSDPPASGDGSEANPYEIATLNNLYWLSQNSTEWDKHCIQTADIDASSTSTWDDGDGGSAEGFSPIGNDGTSFTGTYNGKSHTISNLFINRPSTDNVALFGSITNAFIDSLGVEAVTVIGQQNTGALVGFSNTGSDISCCYASGNISGINGIGGLVGASFSKVSECYSTADVAASGHNNGGLIGYCKNATTNNSYSRGSVTVSGNNSGGLIGVNDGNCTVENCYSTGAVSGGAQDMGGLIGDNGGGTATNSFWDVETSGMTDSWGGTGLSTDDMKDMVNHLNAGWDFVDESLNGNEEYWSFNISVNDGYPFLNWQGNSREDRLVLLTDSITDITTTSATVYANIIYLGSNNPLAHGMCWNTTGDPTLADNSSDEGASTSTGSFSSEVTSMAANTTYFVRAYATDVDGTKYGNEMVFTTYRFPSIGDGTEQSPYEISSLENLSWLAQTPEAWDKHFIQTADIDASATSSWYSGDGWSPIGTSDVSFSGSYDGQGHVISNLYVNRTEYFQGFFGYLNYAEIKNLGLENADITGQSRVGAIAARSEHSTIERCFSTGNVTATETYAGGIVGENYYYGNIFNCYSRCAVNASISWGGGITGSSGNVCEIINCYSTGTVNGTATIGGIVGSNVGTVDNCFWDTSTSGIASSDGGTGKTTTEMIEMATYTDTTTPGLDEAWDFPGYPNDDNGTASIWEMDAALNNGYPTLSWQYASTATIIMHSIDSINPTEAYITCEITNNGGADVTAAGLCWNTTGTPDIGDIISDEGAASGIINTSMTGLSSGGTYYVRPYVTNSEGTTYGNEIVFKTTPASGSGTESDPYEISSMEELVWLMGNQKVWDQHFVQTASIDASESQNWFAYKGFYPVGTNTARFTGSYNGRGYAIDNLYIYRPDANNIALFGHAVGAVLDSISVTNASINTSITEATNYIGTLLSYGTGVTITNCTGSGILRGGSGGGLAGHTGGHSVVEHCSANCEVYSNQAGGLVGNVGTSAVIKNSNSEGTIHGTSYTGGLIGFFRGDSLINSYSTATVVAENDHSGGLVGYLYSGAHLVDCYTNASVQGDNYVGGLIGYLDSDALIEECYSEGTVEGNTYVGGLIGSCINNATIMNCYSHASAAASSSCAGGLIGEIAFISIYNSYSTGSVSGSAHYGGLIGSSFNGTTENCFWDKETSAISFSEGGDGKTTAEMKDVATFTDESTPGLTTAWDFLKNPNDDINFNDHWNITTGINNGYPYFSADYLARVITSTATNIAVDSITSGGNAISDGGSAITEKGVCWSMAAPPVTLDSMLAVGTGTGTFSVNITGLDTSTTYYVRAYAINAIDTSFGNVDTVTTLKAAQSIIFEPISVKTYGDTVFTLSASATSGLEVTFNSSNPDIAMVSNDSVTITGVGTTIITVSQPGNSSFAAADDMEHTLVVDKDTLWVTAHDKSKTYGQTNPELTYNYSDFAYNEDSTVIDTPPEVSTTATGTTNAGAAEIEISGGTDDNYTIIHVNGTLTIQKDTITVTAHDKSRVYGSENPEFTMDYAGFTNGEDASVIDEDPLLSASADTLADAGTYPIVLSGGNDNNYEMKFVNGTLTIQKAALVAHVKDRFKYYGEPNPDFPVQYTGFVNNEDTSVIDELPVASTPATPESNVGSYDIILTGGNDNNYDISLLNGLLIIEKAAQNLTFDIPDRVPADTGSIELNASASSGLPVEYQISNPSAVALNGNTLQILSAGITSITASQSGNSNYNPASIEIQLIIDEVTGIKNSLTVIKVFPNPVKDLLYLDFSNNADSTKHYTITNIHGQVFVSGTVQKNQIDVSGFKPGLYILIMNNQIFRIIKE